jgi:hypothetical protein
MGKSISQAEHSRINAHFWPGTRQLCVQCGGETERCEEDAIYLNDETGPLCEYCYHKSDEYLKERHDNQD